MQSVTVRAPAKINIALTVGPLRPDGYHQLATVYQAIGLYDDIKVRPADDGISVSVIGEPVGPIPTDGSNLAVRAAKLLAEFTGIDEGVSLALRKRIPVAGGMAGGSSDAAATLVACDALWQTEVRRSDLLRLAAALGSDVLFCLLGGTAIGAGRGENISPALVLGEYHWVVAIADRGLSTPEVFQELDRIRTKQRVGEPGVPDAVLSALRAGNAVRLGNALTNDLQPAALRLRPELAAVLDSADEADPLGSLISGAGPTCLFLAGDDQHAREIADVVEESGLVREVAVASGPVHGARIVG